MDIIFMGTPDFAVPCLAALLEQGHTIRLVVTQPDKPKGRGHRFTPPPVKAYALEHGLPVYQPATLRDGDAAARLAQIPADVYIVVAYGKILPESILQLPPHGCINVHASLLPKYRGAAPIQWSIINGETETGVTTMYMEKGLDTGDMLLRRTVPIAPDDTASTLHDKLAAAGADVLAQTLEQLAAGTLSPQKQDDALSCYAPMIDKDTARLDFSRSAAEVTNLVRGMNDYPMARTTYAGRMMKVVWAEPEQEDAAGVPGEIVSVGPEGVRVACSKGAIRITELQFEGGKRLPVSEYLKGHAIETGVVLGE